MVEIRERQRAVGGIDGWARTFSSSTDGVIVHQGSSIMSMVENCEDVVGNFKGNNPFLLSRIRRDYTPWNGSQPRPSGPTYKVVQNYTDAEMRTSNFSHLPVTIKSPSGSQLAARMSPNKPLVALPTFIFELKDLPGMYREVVSFGKALPKSIELIKRAGDHLLNPTDVRSMRKVATKLGEVNLSYSFGWEPLISDLAKVTGFAEAYYRRLEQLTNLMSESGLRRRIKVDKASNSSTQNGISTGAGTVFTVTVDNLTTTEVSRWAVSRWKATNPPQSRKPSELDVIRSLFGLTIDPATVWSVIPWSWMIDWFTDVGNFLDAHRNTIPCQLQGVSLMTHTITTVRRLRRSNNVTWLTGGLGQRVLETKERVPMTLSIIPAEFPFLGARQVGILASLKVTKLNAWRLT